jgi:hypothetical protein
MSREEIERLDDQGMAAWDGHDAEGFANLFADKFAVNDVAMPEPITTKDGVRQYAQGWFTALCVRASPTGAWIVSTAIPKRTRRKMAYYMELIQKPRVRAAVMEKWRGLKRN